MGIGLVPQGRRLFPDMTVRENLFVARRDANGENTRFWNEERVFALFPVLKNMEGKLARYLSGGEQQMLSIARALMGNPELLLLDEPSEGLAPQVLKNLWGQILKLKDTGTSMLLTEQNVRWAAQMADRSYILEKGTVCYSGPTEKLMTEADILKRYLGISSK